MRLLFGFPVYITDLLLSFSSFCMYCSPEQRIVRRVPNGMPFNVHHVMMQSLLHTLSVQRKRQISLFPVQMGSVQWLKEYPCRILNDDSFHTIFGYVFFVFMRRIYICVWSLCHWGFFLSLYGYIYVYVIPSEILYFSIFYYSPHTFFFFFFSRIICIHI